MNSKTTSERKTAERVFARGFTILGGIFWTVTAFAGPYVYGGSTVIGAFSIAVFPLMFTIGVLALGWFYERLTALILAVGAIGTIAWGAIMGWEPSVWIIMMSFFVTPTIIAAVLFYLAGGGTERSADTAEQPGISFEPTVESLRDARLDTTFDAKLSA